MISSKCIAETAFNLRGLYLSGIESVCQNVTLLVGIPTKLHPPLSQACEDGLTPASIAESAMKVLNSCLSAMPAGEL